MSGMVLDDSDLSPSSFLDRTPFIACGFFVLVLVVAWTRQNNKLGSSVLLQLGIFF